MRYSRIMYPSHVLDASGSVPARRACRLSPWSALGLVRNPFGEPSPEELPALIVPTSGEPGEAWLRQPGRVLQILGDAGRGKTSRLRRLEAIFPDANYRYLPEDGPHPALPSPTEWTRPVGLLLDEAQRLPRRTLRRLLAGARRHHLSLALASHADLSADVESAGLDGRTVVVAGLAADRLQRIINRRIDWARAGSGRPPRVGRRHTEQLIARHGDDLRAILDELYDTFQARLREGADDGQV